ncbi:MAG: arylamine N-acetyltransferase family protein [Acidimicrobiales bacterium]
MDSAPDVDVGRYLDRIGFGGEIALDLATLTALQRAHLTAVPFENLDVYHRLGVRTDLAWSVAKVVDRGRGGWCFEANGAFSALLDALGFPVARLGAAVLLDGPNEVIDHLTLEVTLDEPYLVDVGFGDSFISPLRLNATGPQDGGSGTFELIDSPQGRTLTRHDDGVPGAQYRFRRVNRVMAEFESASQQLQGDPDLHWSTKPFATRLLDGGPDRVTLLGDRLKLTRAGEVTETPVPGAEWDDVLHEWFGMRLPT